MKKVIKAISTTLVLTQTEFDTLSNTIDILKKMGQMLNSTDKEEREKVAKAVDALETLWYSDFANIEIKVLNK